MKALALLTLLLLAAGGRPGEARTPTEAEIDAVARELRCVVCQNLSVADSPSEMARQMRDVVRERLAQGDSPQQVKAYFVQRYGEWVLLSPPASGFALVAWGLPVLALAAGIAGWLIVLRRWTVRSAAGRAEDEDVDAADLEAVRREVAKRR